LSLPCFFIFSETNPGEKEKKEERRRREKRERGDHKAVIRKKEGEDSPKDQMRMGKERKGKEERKKKKNSGLLSFSFLEHEAVFPQPFLSGN